MTTTSTHNKSDYEVLLPRDIPLEMIKVEGGTFMMGGNIYNDEKPIHKVKVPDFYIGKYPVTQEQWVAVMGSNPARFTGITNPVERVSWEDIQMFLEKLNKWKNISFRLPSEGEWEYAARGGRYNQELLYAGSNNLKEVGWYKNNSNGQTHSVGLKPQNELDIYDMSGNVLECCADHWHENYEGATKNGSSWIAGGDEGGRVVRGGSWLYDDIDCRPLARSRIEVNSRYSFIGFRLARHCPPEL